jgi:hypothetical protein
MILVFAGGTILVQWPVHSWPHSPSIGNILWGFIRAVFGYYSFSIFFHSSKKKIQRKNYFMPSSWWIFSMVLNSKLKEPSSCLLHLEPVWLCG